MKPEKFGKKSNTNHSHDSVGEWKIGIGGKEPTTTKKVRLPEVIIKFVK